MVRTLFILAAAVGLAFNLWGDLVGFRRAKEAVKTGDWVSRSYDVTRAIDAVRISILESTTGQQPVSQISDNIRVLNALVLDMPLQEARVALLRKLLSERPLKVLYVSSLRILAEMEASEVTLLDERTKADDEAGQAVVTQSIFANTVDVLLIFIFLGFYFYEKQKSEKLQSALSKTLIGVEASSQRLRLAIAQKNAKFKTTVHDLKNPLGSIKSFAELMYGNTTNKDAVTEMADLIQKVSSNTLDLVGSLLTDADFDAGDGAPANEPIHVDTCLAETCAFLGAVAQEKRQKIQIKSKPSEFVFMGHKHQVQDVFFNVVGNALKFSPKGSTIAVESGDAGENHEIRVIDAGPGFAKDDFQKLFKQGVTLSAKPTGSEVSVGFGLYSAKQSLNDMGATILIDNNVTGGACVTIRFPISVALTPPPRRAASDVVVAH